MTDLSVLYYYSQSLFYCITMRALNTYLVYKYKMIFKIKLKM